MPIRNISFKLTRKTIKMLISGFGIILLFFLWKNILILDDLHHDFNENFISNSTSLEEPSTSPQSGSEPKDTEYHIHINLDVKQLYLYKKGQLVRTFPCSGGRPDTPSPEGDWRIISKDTWGEGFGGSWLGLDVPWGKYGIHGTLYPWFIGRSNESKGCIRLHSEDAAELYRLVSYGTTVTIQQKNRPFKNLMNGDTGPDVRDLQKALHALGYYTDSIDGRYGDSLYASVLRFQKDHKLEPTGNTDKATFDLALQKAGALE